MRLGGSICRDGLYMGDMGMIERIAHLFILACAVLFGVWLLINAVEWWISVVML